MNIYSPLIFAFIAIFFLYIGIKIIASKRPLLLSSKIFFIFMLLAFSPQFVMSLERLLMSTGDMGLIFYISPLMLVGLLTFMWIQMQGFMAIGITDDSFRSALHYSLNKNKIQFEEQLSLIRLTDINVDVQIAIQSWIGTGQLKLNRSKDKELLSKLVSNINEYYLANSIKPNNTTSILYIVMGLFMSLLSAYIYFLIR